MAGLQEEFLRRASVAARAAEHIFPEYAACEAALESGWGLSKLAVEANNLFGQKAAHGMAVQAEMIAMPTREYLHGAWITVKANWLRFAGWDACFAARMALLRRLSSAYPHYAAALKADNGDVFVDEVSRSWSTDPGRAGKVLSIYDHYEEVFLDQVHAA